MPEFEPLPGMQRDVQLAPMTTLGIGGPARFFSRVRSTSEVADAVRWSDASRVPLFVLGGGSNVLVSDRGYDGLVIQIELQGLSVRNDGDSVLVTAAAGEMWDGLVARAVTEGWAGVECLSGIPGSVGATPIQNVGAYGQEVAETIVNVAAFDRVAGTAKELTAEECRFGYRTSRFKEEDRGRYVILWVTYRLRPGGEPAVKYPDLAAHLAEAGVAQPSLDDVRQAVIAVRRRKGMVLDPDDPDTRSDGSFFMNPVLPGREYERFLDRARRSVGEAKIPAFAAGRGFMKLSAAWLIEKAGFSKGYGRGGVRISTKHTLAIVNRGGGTAAEVLALVREIQGRVRDEFGVELQPEPTFLGFE